MRVSAAWLFLTTVPACIPVMPHPTRVDPAFRVGMNASFSYMTDSQSTTGEVTALRVPSFDFDASLGIRDTSSSDRAAMRLSASAGFSGFGGSFYVEGPRPWLGDFDAGLGLAAHHGSMNVLMPYLQFGREYRSTASWFVRNGIVVLSSAESSTWRTLWMPTVGLFRHIEGRDASVYVSGIIGGHQPRVERYCLFFECLDYSNSYTRTYLILGATVSLPLARASLPR